MNKIITPSEKLTKLNNLLRLQKLETYVEKAKEQIKKHLKESKEEIKKHESY